MRPSLLVPSLLLVMLALLGGCGGSRPAGSPRHEAEDFFQKLGESRFQEAYNATTFSFQAQTNFQEFRATAKELGFTAGTVNCHWTKEEPSEKEVRLTGEIVPAGGTGIPIVVMMVREGGLWRIFSVRSPAANGKKETDCFSLVGKGNAFNSSTSQEVPPLPLLQRLTLESLMLFNEAIAENNIDEFYNQISTAWRDQITVEKLKRAFQPFIDAKLNLLDIQQMEPIYDTPPEINTNGFLVLQGHYDLKPQRISFTLQYIYEFPYWKLCGLGLQIH